MRQAVEPDPDLDAGPSKGCLLSLAGLCFFWAGVIVLIWGWPW